MTRALEVHGVTVATSAGESVVDDVSFTLDRGEVLGIAGESGCGKSTLALALLGYARSGLQITSGAVSVGGVDLLAVDEAQRRPIRGRQIAYVSQDASKSLNPAMRVGALMSEVMRVHGTGGSDDDVRRALRRVLLADDAGFLRRFPHQLSGGQQQRLAIGMALACDPSVLVLDEPTTGLDVVTQSNILDEVGRIAREHDVACIFVSHDLAAMASFVDRIAVLYAGRIVEQHRAHPLLLAPKHPYTAGLVASVPVHTRPDVVRGIPGIAVGVSDRPVGCAFAPRCAQRTAECEAAMPALVDIDDGHRVRCLHWESTPEPLRSPRPESTAADFVSLLLVRDLLLVHGRGDRTVVAADSVSFDVANHACVALVGESGSGKSTIARAIAGLHAQTDGSIEFAGEQLAPHAKQRTADQRRRLQIVFQNSYDSLNPAHTVEQAIARPLQLFFGTSPRNATERVAEVMERVRLPKRLAGRYPRQLSGGERQRVAIARALAPEPELLICDEVTSSLDVSVQAAVLELLRSLDIALLFITHDFGVVTSIADRVLVLQHGVVREHGAVADVMQSPQSDYAQRLIGAIPQLPMIETGAHE